MAQKQHPPGGAALADIGQPNGVEISAPPGDLQSGAEIVIPLHVEDAVFEKRVAQTGMVRVALKTASHERHVDELLMQEHVAIERVPVGRVVEAAPPIREEGDTTIISVVEEVLVLERRLVLKEEVRITRVRTTETHRETVQLREQFATVTRSDAGPAPTTNPPTSRT